MKHADSFSLTSTLRSEIPSLRSVPLQRIKSDVMGDNYELGVRLVGDAYSKRLNHIYRNKDKTANILSFPYDKQSGDIIINIRKAEREYRKFGFHSVSKYVGFLFIHGLFHLKGYDHGSRMEHEEQLIRARFHLEAIESRS